MKHSLIGLSSQENASLQLPLKRTLREPLRPRDIRSRSEKGNDLWLLTLSDLLLILLIFFVLLFGMTLPQQPQEAHSPMPQVPASTRSEETPVEIQPAQAPDLATGEVFASIETDIRAIIGNENGEEEVNITRRADHLVLTFPERIVFDPGRAQLKPSALSILEKVASLALAHPSFLLEVLGHTDDRSISTKRYPSNWELSVDRATQVVKALIGLGLDPAQISVKGFGEYRTLYPNDSNSNRRKNRRVEIQFSLAPQI